MSSSTDRSEKHDDPSGYAPKWVRDRNQEKRYEFPSVPEGEFPEHNEQTSDQARARRPLDANFRGEAGLRLPRSLDPEFVREPRPARRATGRLAALVGLIIAASAGAAIALLATGKLPSELNKMLGLGADNMTVASKPSADTKTMRAQPALATAPPAAITSGERPSGEELARVASARSATERAPTIRGVTDNGRKLRVLTIIDTFSRFSPAVEPRFHFAALML